MNKYEEAFKSVNEFCVEEIYDDDGFVTGDKVLSDYLPREMQTLKELVDKTKTPSLENVRRKWEALGYELIIDYGDIHFVKKEEDSIYNKPVYYHFVFNRVGQFFAYETHEVGFSFFDRHYFIIHQKECKLLTKTFKALGWSDE